MRRTFKASKDNSKGLMCPIATLHNDNSQRRIVTTIELNGCCDHKPYLYPFLVPNSHLDRIEDASDVLFSMPIRWMNISLAISVWRNLRLRLNGKKKKHFHSSIRKELTMGYGFCLSILEVRTLDYEMCILTIFSLIRIRQIIFLAMMQFASNIEQSW